MELEGPRWFLDTGKSTAVFECSQHFRSFGHSINVLRQIWAKSFVAHKKNDFWRVICIFGSVRQALATPVLGRHRSISGS